METKAKYIHEFARRLEDLEEDFLDALKMLKKGDLNKLGNVGLQEGEDGVLKIDFYRNLNEPTSKVVDLARKATLAFRYINTWLSLEDNLIIHDAKVKGVLDKIKNYPPYGTYNSIAIYTYFLIECEKKIGIPIEKFEGSDVPIILSATTDENTLFDIDSYLELDEEEWQKSFGLRAYLRNKRIIGPLVTSKEIPDSAKMYFNELKEISAHTSFQCELSCFSLCRSILESSLYDKLKRVGYFKNRRIVSFDIYKDDTLHVYIKEAKKAQILNTKFYQICTNIKKKANAVVHLKGAKGRPTFEEMEDIIKDTIRVVEFLYR